jgi:hypothetical protein
LDPSQFEGNFAVKTKSKPKQVPTNANFIHSKAAIQDIEFFSFENSFVLSCDSSLATLQVLRKWFFLAR